MPDRIFTRDNIDELQGVVAAITDRTPVTDVHTHLFSPAFGDLLLWGIDEVVTYHYLIAEAMRVSDVPYDRFWAMSKEEQADLIWDELFVKRSPVSEACRGPLTVLQRLGVDVSTRDLNAYRAYFKETSVRNHVDKVLACANLESVVMTNDPFDPIERAVWDKNPDRDSRFHAALRIDPLLNDWAGACEKLKAWGYAVSADLDAETLKEVRRFLEDWIKRMDALYMAVSLPPDFTFPEDSARGTLIAECVLPVARECSVPFAMMTGVKRNVNPALKLAADGVGKSEVDAVARLCAGYPDNKFMITMLARENQHELCIAARKFRNLCLFGCWWYLNDPSLIEEMTRMRMELLGLSFIPQHSDARILDQVIYKWTHSRQLIAKVLTDKYTDMVATGWPLTEAEIERDISRLLSQNFWDFLGR